MTFAYLIVGLTIFGIGEALLIAAGVGVSPWTVLAQGFGLQAGLSIGWATFIVSAAVLLLWIPLRQMPGLGTLMNAIVISFVIEFSLPYLPHPQILALQLLEATTGVLLVGMGSGLYLTARLGPGPRDGLMTGLQAKTGYPIAWVRMSLEILAVGLGWSLGGTVGVGTLMFAFGIGPAVSLGLHSVKSVFRGV